MSGHGARNRQQGKNNVKFDTWNEGSVLTMLTLNFTMKPHPAPICLSVIQEIFLPYVTCPLKAVNSV